MSLNAQQWLDQEYPENNRKNVIELDLRSKELEGDLFIENWPNLERLDCGWNQKLINVKISNLPKLSFFSSRNCQLSNLSVENCPEISYFNVKKNSLSRLNFVDNLSPKKINFLDVGGNNFFPQDLSVFSRLTNLEEFYFGSSFVGSLESLKSLVRLKSLGVFSSNVDSDLEYLPVGLERIYLQVEKESDKGLKMWGELKDYSIRDKYEFLCYDYQAWRENNAERIEVANVDKVILLRQVKELQKRISYLEKQKESLESLLQKNPSSINIGSVPLYSGDVITLEVENGKYLKRTRLQNKVFFKKEKEVTVQITEENYPNESSYFVAEIIESNKIRLRTLDEKLYWKVYDEKSRENPVYFTDDVDESTLFLINSDRSDSKITLQLASNKKKYLRLKDNKSIVAQERLDDNGVFLLHKQTDYQKKVDDYQEVIEDVQIHMERKKVKVGKSTYKELTQKNWDNNSQKYTLSYSETYVKSTEIDWGISLSVGVQNSFTTGIPLMMEGGITFQLGVGITAGGHYVQSNSETVTGTLEVTCPGNSAVVAKAVLQEYDLEVPITTTISRSIDGRKYIYRVDGTFKGRYARVFVNYEKSFMLTILENQIGQPSK